ncbi:MAG: hypothetical protein A2562_01395 [Candidatus Nealsonbacteria bacterium RIFOXYD1_FULL_39_11]|nr:MAG: hypothetical protein A2562_01395 [Candidatus Nealsonbacteria bacterium RIFOXYD1_FULL_39_11]
MLNRAGLCGEAHRLQGHEAKKAKLHPLLGITTQHPEEFLFTLEFTLFHFFVRISLSGGV